MQKSPDLRDIISSRTDYNFHTHTQFCDGHATMDEMVKGAGDADIRLLGFSPHSPVCVPSPCNMPREAVPLYLDEMERLREAYPDVALFTGMEIDYISEDFGPFIDYFQKLPLDYSIGSVHFVPTQEGIPVDCDGSPERFARNLEEAFSGDLRYVVETFYIQVIRMIERGGFDILGHFDKIASNASSIDPEIEDRHWYISLVDDVIEGARSTGLIVEVNTKALEDRKRIFPSESLLPRVIEAGVPLMVNSDAHWPGKVNLGRDYALNLIEEIKNR